MHRAVGSQLIYNRDSKESLFSGSSHFQSFPHYHSFQTQSSASDSPTIASYTIDSTGTTEIQATDENPVCGKVLRRILSN